MHLYVDDLRKEPDGWVLARTITEAIRILATQHVESVSLDHDIANDCCGRASFETFEPVARFLCASGYQGLIFIHTANPVGAQKLKNIFEEAGLSAGIRALND